MLIFRRLLTFIVTLFLIVLLTVFSLSLNTKLILNNKQYIKNQINQQGIYSVLINKIAYKAGTIVGNRSYLSGLNGYVKTNIKSIYNFKDFQYQSNNIFDANYSWLAGKTTKPEFRIDFS